MEVQTSFNGAAKPLERRYRNFGKGGKYEGRSDMVIIGNKPIDHYYHSLFIAATDKPNDSVILVGNPKNAEVCRVLVEKMFIIGFEANDPLTTLVKESNEFGKIMVGIHYKLNRIPYLKRKAGVF